MTLGALVGIVALVSTFVAGDLLQRRGHFDKRWWWMIRNTIFIIVTAMVHGVDVIAMLQTAHILFTRIRLMAELAAIVARRQFFVQLILAEIGEGRQLEAWMHMLAVGSLRTEAGQVVHAQHTPQMLMSTVRPMAAESTFIPRTVFHLALWVDVQERALFVVAGIETRIEITLWHFRHVVLVQKLALVALFTQTTQPVLTDDGAIAPYVPKWAGASFVAFLAIFCDEIADGGYGLVHAIERQWYGAHLFDKVALRFKLEAVYVGQKYIHLIAVLFS